MEHTNPNSDQGWKPPAKVLAAVGILAILVAAVYYFFWYRMSEPVTFSGSVNAAKTLCFEEGKCEEAVQELEQLLSRGSSKNQEGFAKTHIALFYLSTDVARSIRLFKEIAADASYKDAHRAYAVETIGDIFMLSSGQYRNGFLTPLIFSGDPYASFLSGDPIKNVPEAVRRLYEYASEFSPRPASEYRVAEWYAKQTYYAKFDPEHLVSPVPRDEYVSIITDRLQMGDAAMALASLGELDAAYAYWLRGRVLGLLADAVGEKKYQEEAKNSFEQSLQILRQYQGPYIKHWRSHILWASFYYASFLAKNPDEKERAVMDELIGYLTAPEARTKKTGQLKGPESFKFGLMKYLERGGNTTSTIRSRDTDYVAARLIAVQEPRFAELLKDLGWEL